MRDSELDRKIYKKLGMCRFSVYNDIMETFHQRLRYHFYERVIQPLYKGTSALALEHMKKLCIYEKSVSLRTAIIHYVDELEVKGYSITNKDMVGTLEREILGYNKGGFNSLILGKLVTVFEPLLCHDKKKTSRGRSNKECDIIGLSDVVKKIVDCGSKRILMKILTELNRRIIIGDVPTGFENCTTILLAQIFWIQHGLLERREEMEIPLKVLHHGQQQKDEKTSKRSRKQKDEKISKRSRHSKKPVSRKVQGWHEKMGIPLKVIHHPKQKDEKISSKSRYSLLLFSQKLQVWHEENDITLQVPHDELN